MMKGKMSSLEQELSDLEKQRLENIARNSQYLHDLGINTQSGTLRSKSQNRKKGEIKSTILENEEPVRRSSRIASLPGNVNFTEDRIQAGKTSSSSSSKSPITDETDLASTTKRRKITHTSDLPVGTFLSNEKNEQNAQNAPVSKAGFASGMQADVAFWCHPDRLAQPIEEFGKAAVMALSVCGANGLSRSTQTSVRFNKFSGVAEWQNALFLWVNLPSEGTLGQFDNAFSAGGRHMMWFGGSTMHAESRVVQRLIHASNRCVEQTRDHHEYIKKEEVETKERKRKLSIPASNIKEEHIIVKDELRSALVTTEDAADTESHTVLLFVRHEGDGYACLGRCKYVAMNLQSHPIEIKWHLNDFETLKMKPYFQELVSNLKTNK